MSTVPSDSVLRRHHEQMQRAARLVPTDSVLRRHYEQMQQAARPKIGSSPATAPAEPPAPPPEAAVPEPRSAPVRAASKPETGDAGGGGLFGWLKRLFGG